MQAFWLVPLTCFGFEIPLPFPTQYPLCLILGSLSMRVFETRTATGSELISFLTCPHTTTLTLLSLFSPLEMSSIKIWETIGLSTQNVLFWLPSASQKHACLSSLLSF